MTDLCVPPEILKKIIKIISTTYPKAVILSYGSRVRGDFHSGSDLDLVVKDFGQEDGRADVLKRAFTESDIPFFVDVLELESLSQNFIKEIEKEYITIYNGKN